MDWDKISALEETISREHGNITGLIVEKDGETLYENYFHGFTAGDAVHVFSVTKSIFSALVGIAVGKGCIKSVDQKVLDFFPDFKVSPGERMIQSITLRHLLTMTAPYRCRTEPYEAFFSSDDWVETALGLLGGENPPGEFYYSPIVGTHILGAILARAVGRPVLDFASECLFSPLGIDIPRSVAFQSAEEQMAWYAQKKHAHEWVADPRGVHTAGWGLTLTPGDLEKIGRLYLDGGVWEGRQLIPAGWIEESTREQSRWGELAYGYLWWVIDGRARCYAAMGDGGNVLYINAQKKLVVTIAALFAPEAGDRIALIREQIGPAFDI